MDHRGCRRIAATIDVCVDATARMSTRWWCLLSWRKVSRTGIPSPRFLAICHLFACSIIKVLFLLLIMGLLTRGPWRRRSCGRQRFSFGSGLCGFPVLMMIMGLMSLLLWLWWLVGSARGKFSHQGLQRSRYAQPATHIYQVAGVLNDETTSIMIAGHLLLGTGVFGQSVRHFFGHKALDSLYCSLYIISILIELQFHIHPRANFIGKPHPYRIPELILTW